MRTQRAPAPRTSRKPNGEARRLYEFGRHRDLTPVSRERLDVLRAAFYGDPRPGFLLEGSQVVEWNAAASEAIRASGEAGKDPSRGVVDATLERWLGSDSHPWTAIRMPAISRKDCRNHIVFLEKRILGGRHARLSNAEERVVERLVRGMQTREIASELRLSAETVRKHVVHAMQRMGVHTRVGLIASLLRR